MDKVSDVPVVLLRQVLWSRQYRKPSSSLISSWTKWWSCPLWCKTGVLVQAVAGHRRGDRPVHGQGVDVPVAAHATTGAVLGQGVHACCCCMVPMARQRRKLLRFHRCSSWTRLVPIARQRRKLWRIPQVQFLAKVYMTVVVASGADGQTAQKTR